MRITIFLTIKKTIVLCTNNNNHLKKYLIQKATDEKSKQLSSNYLPMLLQMRRVYNQKADFNKVMELDKSIDAISIQCNKYKKVQKLKTKY